MTYIFQYFAITFEIIKLIKDIIQCIKNLKIQLIS